MSAPLAVSTLEPARPDRRAARAAVAGLVIAVLVAGWLLWDNRRLDVTHYQVATQALPAEADDLRIAQVSDLHASDFGTFSERLVEQVAAAQPDLVAITGDLIDIRTRDLGAVLELVARLEAIAPVYVVLGNHEAGSERREDLLEGLREAGAEVLRDEARQLTVDGTEITLIGLDDPWVAPADGSTRSEPRTVLSALQIPDGAPVVLLAHRPEMLDQYAAAPVDVVLSGHAHGGQVRVPLLGGLYAPHQGWMPTWTEGTHTVDGTTMVISRGLGNSSAGVRVNNPRELVIVDLQPAAEL